MGRPLICAENLLSTVYFTGHKLIASSEATSFEISRIARGTLAQFNKWTPAVFNTEVNFRVEFDRLRAFDFLYLAGHNLDGKTIKIQVTSDQLDFSGSFTEIFNAALPSAVAQLPATNATGALTETGAWLKRFSQPIAGRAVRIVIPAMGTDLRPEIRYAMLGLSWQADVPDLPQAPNVSELVAEILRGDTGWEAAGRIGAPRVGEIRLRLRSEWEQSIARYHLEGHFARRRPMVLIWDDEMAQDALLVVRRAGDVSGLTFDRDWGYYTYNLRYVEVDAK